MEALPPVASLQQSTFENVTDWGLGTSISACPLRYSTVLASMVPTILSPLNLFSTHEVTLDTNR